MKNDIVAELHEKKLLDSIPVDLLKIASEYEVRVEKKYIYNLSGKIIKEQDNNYAIYISILHPLVRQRFTLAHELAHFFLHKEQIGDGISEDALLRSGISNEIEGEANRLAAEIIMPAHKIKERVHDYLSWGHKKDMQLAHNLATEFQVSPKAMKIRIGV